VTTLQLPPRPSVEIMWLEFSRTLRTIGPPLDTCRHVFYVGAFFAVYALLEEIDTDNPERFSDYVADLETELRTWINQFERPM
jgi:hypothetical protein